MSHIELDDQILNHPKFVRANDQGGSDTIFLWLGLRAYCGQFLSDGFVPEYMISDVRGPKDPKKRATALSTLKSVGLVEDADGGVFLHDYLDHSPSREQVLTWKATAKIRAALRSNPALMRLVRERDGGHCRYCGKAVNWTIRKGENSATYDHVIPISLGGDNSPENVVTCCRSCNSKKGNRSPSDCGLYLIPVGSDKTTDSLPVGSDKTTGLTHARARAQAVEKEVEDQRSGSEGGAGGSWKTPAQRCSESFEISCPESIEFTDKHQARAKRCGAPVDELYEQFRAKRLRDKATYGDPQAVCVDFDGWLLTYARNQQQRQAVQPGRAGTPPGMAEHQGLSAEALDRNVARAKAHREREQQQRQQQGARTP